MRTTAGIQEDSLIRARKRAVALWKPLRALIEEDLRRCLAVTADPTPATGGIEWVVAEGDTPEGQDLADREAMHEWIPAHDPASSTRRVPWSLPRTVPPRSGPTTGRW